MSINPTPSGGPNSAALSGSPFDDAAAPLSASLFVTVNTGLMGQPFGSNQAFHLRKTLSSLAGSGSTERSDGRVAFDRGHCPARELDGARR